MNATRSLSLALVLLASAALPAAFGPSPAAADAPEETQLLVKCHKNEVANVLAALASRRVRVYDLKTMAEVHGPGKTGALPSLPDAAKAMAEFERVLGSLLEAGGSARLNEFTARSTKLLATLDIPGPDVADRISTALAEAPFFRSRAAVTRLGAMTRTGERWSVKVLVEFGSTGSSDAPPEGLGSVPLQVVEHSARAAGMRLLSAGAERVSRDRRTGAHGVVSRELRFAPGRLSQLVALLDLLSAAHGLTVSEVRWKLDPKGPKPDAIGTSVVHLATRATAR